MMFVCCFCDQARDESTGNIDLFVNVVSRTPEWQDTIVSYTCCHACLQGDPRAITFRTRQNKPNLSVLAARAGVRRSVAA